MAKIWGPQPKQVRFLCRPEYEALYGGAAGGGADSAQDRPGAVRAHRQEPELLPEGVPRGEIQRECAPLDVPGRRDGRVRGDAPDG